METEHEATAPATPSGQTVSAEQLLAPFVGRSDPRFWMNQPISIRGDLVACNGHIFVCVTGAGLGVATNPAVSVTMFDLHAAGTDRAWDDALVAIESVQPVLADGQAVECGTCKGRGRVIVDECDECDGGTFVHGSHEYTCMECGGEGHFISAGDDHECPTCHGSGVNRDLRSTIVDGTMSVSYHYIKQMQSLPECFIEAKAQEKQKQKCFYFRFRGGWGLVMSCRA